MSGDDDIRIISFEEARDEVAAGFEDEAMLQALGLAPATVAVTIEGTPAEASVLGDESFFRSLSFEG
jgi:sulfur carrier protein ThiS